MFKKSPLARGKVDFSKDVDQVFGDVTKWIRKNLHSALTITDFQKSLQHFAENLQRPFERLRRVVMVDKVRDWKTHVEYIPKRVVGIAGPTAPRVFDMVRREGWTILSGYINISFFLLKY